MCAIKTVSEINMYFQDLKMKTVVHYLACCSENTL